MTKEEVMERIECLEQAREDEVGEFFRTEEKWHRELSKIAAEIAEVQKECPHNFVFDYKMNLVLCEYCGKVLVTIDGQV